MSTSSPSSPAMIVIEVLAIIAFAHHFVVQLVCEWQFRGETRKFCLMEVGCHKSSS